MNIFCYNRSGINSTTQTIVIAKAERIDYARRLERIESLKAKGGMSDGGKGSQISDNLRTDEIISEKQ